MSWIPGWSSVAGTAWWSGFYFWVSICALIALGVAEVASHRYADRKDELAAIEQEAIQRRHDEDMVSLQHDTAQANERAAQLEKDAATANAEAAKANDSAAKANERAGELKLALEKEIAARQPRGVSPSQKQMIIDLTREEPKGPAVVVWKMFDEEAERFAKQLIDALSAAGYDAKEGPGAMSFGQPGQWIIVRNRDWLIRPTYAGSIQGTLRKALGLEFNGNVRQDPIPDIADVLIIVGAHP